MAEESSAGHLKNFYRTKKLDGESYLVTTEHGSWSLLSEEEYQKLRLEDMEKGGEFYRHLENRGIILTEDNIENVVKEYAVKNHFLFSGPSLHIITPTLRCNQSCIYCHSDVKDKDSEGFDLDMETAKKIVEFAFQSPSEVLRFEFQGGEPLLRLDLVEEVVGYARKLSEKHDKSVSFSLVSNLTEIDKQKARKLKKMDISVSTSLDGPEEVHDHNRKYLGGEGTYRDVVEGIEMLKDCGIGVNALSTITQKSLDFPRRIVDEYLRHGFDKIWLRPLNRIGFAEEQWEGVGYSPEEFTAFYKEALDYILEDKEGDITELTALLLSKKILQVSDPNMTEMTSPCGAGISQLLYDFNGNIYSCDEGKVFEEFRLGNVMETKWNEIFRDDTFLSMVDISSKKGLLCNSCVWEPFCAVCPVNAYSSQGTVVPKLAQTFRCNLYGNLIEDVFKRLLFSKKQREILEGWVKEEKTF